MKNSVLSTEVLVDGELEKRLLPNKKTILYIGIKYDYGHPEWGLSYEHYNFYETFLNMGYSLIYFDYMRLSQKYGIDIMSELLREAVYHYNPNILFYFHFHDWVKHNVWSELPVKTVIWLADDQWRYDKTKPVWELFDLIVTTDKSGYEKRKGEHKVLLSQWGCNHLLYRNLNLPKIYDITFVGRCHGERKKFADTLKDHKIPIRTFGQGWGDNGRISQAGLIRIYNQSKIVLNMSITSKGGKIQIKGRDFEVPGCGSLLLTQESKEIEAYFEPDNEIITYKNIDDAIKKIEYYLIDNDEREKIAGRGYQRVLKEHTYEKRLEEVVNAGME